MKVLEPAMSPKNSEHSKIKKEGTTVGCICHATHCLQHLTWVISLNFTLQGKYQHLCFADEEIERLNTFAKVTQLGTTGVQTGIQVVGL